MIKNYVIDTNVAIHDPDFLNKFEDNNIILPITCIEELDNLKKREGIVGYNARLAARNINLLRGDTPLNKGVKTPSGGSLRIEMNHMDFSVLPDGLDAEKNDNRILAITKNIQMAMPEMETILVSKDICMTLKADSMGVNVEDYQNDKIHVEELYKGYKEIMMPSNQIDEIFMGGLKLEVDYPIFPNQFFHVTASDNPTHQLLARCDGDKLVPLKYSTDIAWGLKPINREQKMAFELLMDPDIHFVSISGGAGSGKTILSTAVALQKVIESGDYNKIVFVRPVVAAGNDIGYLPGSEEEKLRPWMGSFYDSIENLMDHKSQKRASYGEKPQNVYVDDMIDYWRTQGLVETKTLTYMRGRTFNKSIVLVDEAQEITPHLAKLMLTRAGFHSKFVFIGDPSDNQIDNTLVDSKSNGLVYAIEKMKHYHLTGHITLNQVERSPLAELAEKSL